LLASPLVDERAKKQLHRQFINLDPVALLKAIRETQQELAAYDSGSQPPARATDDLSAFLAGLATAWQKIDSPRRPERRKSAPHWWRTRIDPFAYTWPLVEEWLRAEPNALPKDLMRRLCEQFPNVYPTGAQLRTLQRRVQLWRHEQVKRLIFASTGTAANHDEVPMEHQNIGPLTILSGVRSE
jgi:hypothetical protein